MIITTMKYNLTMLFNGETKKKRSDDLKKAILSVKPDVVLTETYISINPVGTTHKIERRLPLKLARQLFINESFLDVFLTNLNLKEYAK